MGKYTKQSGTLKLNNTTWYTLPKVRNRVNKYIGRWPQYERDEAQYTKFLDIWPSEKILPQFFTRKYEMLRIIVDHVMV